MSPASTPMRPSLGLLMGFFALHNLEENLFIGRGTAFNQKRLAALGMDKTWYRQDRLALSGSVIWENVYPATAAMHAGHWLLRLLLIAVLLGLLH
jgi:hypothetical protein